MLIDVNEIKIAVTHAHADHYNLINPLFFYNNLLDANRIKGILVCARDPLVALKNWGERVVTVTNVNSNSQVIDRFLQDSLFSSQCEGYIQAFLENNLFTHNREPKSQDYFHDMNIVFKVSVKIEEDDYQSVLLPGDASTRLINDLLMLYKDGIFSNVVLLFWIHHGSVGTGQESILSHSPSVASIISSYPQASWNLPKDYILSFLGEENGIPRIRS